MMVNTQHHYLANIHLEIGKMKGFREKIGELVIEIDRETCPCLGTFSPSGGVIQTSLFYSPCRKTLSTSS